MTASHDEYHSAHSLHNVTRCAVFLFRGALYAKRLRQVLVTEYDCVTILGNRFRSIRYKRKGCARPVDKLRLNKRCRFTQQAAVVVNFILRCACRNKRSRCHVAVQSAFACGKIINVKLCLFRLGKLLVFLTDCVHFALVDRLRVQRIDTELQCHQPIFRLFRYAVGVQGGYLPTRRACPRRNGDKPRRRIAFFNNLRRNHHFCPLLCRQIRYVFARRIPLVCIAREVEIYRNILGIVDPEMQSIVSVRKGVLQRALVKRAHIRIAFPTLGEIINGAVFVGCARVVERTKGQTAVCTKIRRPSNDIGDFKGNARNVRSQTQSQVGREDSR